MNQILLEVLMNCTKYFDLSSSLTASCLQDSLFVECVDYIFLDWFARCFLQMNVRLKLTMDDLVYVFDVWRKWSCGVVCVWPKTNSDTIVSMFISLCYLAWMIYGSKFIWCDLLTSKIYQFEGTVLVSLRIFVNKIKKMIILTRTKLSIVSRMLHVLNIQ